MQLFHKLMMDVFVDIYLSGGSHPTGRMLTQSRSQSLTQQQQHRPSIPRLPSSSSSSHPHHHPHHPHQTTDRPPGSQQPLLYKTTSLEARSRSPSPNRQTTQRQASPPEYYGTANLTDRSRSPSPELSGAGGRWDGTGGGGHRGPRRPGPPRKPNVLNLTKRRSHGSMPQVLPSPTVPHIHKSPGNINFPRLNASPTRFPVAISSPPPNPGPVSNGAIPSGDAAPPHPHATAKKMSKASSTHQIWLPGGTDRPDARRTTRHLSQIDLPRDYGSVEEGQAWIQGASSSNRPKPPPSAAATLPRGFKQSQVLDVDKIFNLPQSSYSKQDVVDRNSDSDEDEDDDGEWC